MTPTPSTAQRNPVRRTKNTARSTAHVRTTVSDVHMNLLTDADVIDATTVDVRSAFDRVRFVAKRSIDVIGALILLVVTSPAFVIVALIIKFDSRGPIFFSHWRLGRDGRHFPCLKFRSMKQDAESELHRCEELRHEYVSNHFKIPAERDPRITRFGRFLRKSSVDELPQLLNVLRGDMSLVGPRPIVPVEGTHYGDQLGTLLSVRPGLTGAWAVGGRNRVGYPERAELELAYATHWTLRNDLKILLQTPWAVVTQRGAM